MKKKKKTVFKYIVFLDCSLRCKVCVLTFIFALTTNCQFLHLAHNFKYLSRNLMISFDDI